MLFSGLVAFVVCLSVVAAQDLSVPSKWRKPSNTRSRQERINIASRAIQAIQPQLNKANAEFQGIGYWQSGNVWSSIADFDYVTGSKPHQSQVISNLNEAFNLHRNFDKFGYNDDALWWAQASLYGYRIYKDKTLLNHAVATWESVSKFVITNSTLSTQTLPGKNFKIAAKCDGKSMEGGVFWRPTTGDKSVNSVTTGLYMTLSAFLAEITHEDKYKTAAIRSASWLERVNLQSNFILLDSMNAQDCSRSPATWIFTYNSGKFIEGLSVLADVTKDAHWHNLMVNVVASAVHSKKWQGDDGIITEGSSRTTNNDGVGFKSVFIRGLYEAFRRNSQSAPLRNLIRSYINVQYNALLDLAAKGDAYSAAWHGPSQNFTTWGQLAALDVLVSAIGTN